MSSEQPSFYSVFLSLVEKGEYEIDASGRVFHLRNRRSGRRIHTRCDYIDKYGYRRVVFPFKGKTRNCMVHKLMWMFFKGPVSEDLQINHKDGDKENNVLDNLELVTRSGNIRHAIYVLKRRKMYGSGHYWTKIPLRDIARIFWWHAHGMKVKEISSRLNISLSHVKRILKRESRRIFE